MIPKNITTDIQKAYIIFEVKSMVFKIADTYGRCYDFSIRNAQ